MVADNSQPSLLHADLFANPYPVYHQLRAYDPVHWDQQLDSWILTRYADIVGVLHDQQRFAAQRIGDLDKLEEFGLEEMRPLFSTLSKMILFLDPPDHTRLRSLMNKAFTPRVVEGMRGQIQGIVDGVLDEAEQAGRMDVIRDLAYPLPTTVIAVMLGVPPEDRDKFKVWSDDFAKFIGTFTMTTEEMAQVQRSILELIDYFSDVARQLRKEPKDDLMSALVNAEVQGDKLTEEELFANCVLLLAAGHETTTNLLGNGLLALLRNPDQMGQLRNDPALIGSAVEELLRYDSPVQLTARRATQDVEIGGKKISAGQFVTLMLGAGNRDPERFPDPDRLDLARRENRHLSFGYASHFCLGAPLARLEGQIAINSLLKRFPTLYLESEDLQWQEMQALHGLKALPVGWGRD